MADFRSVPWTRLPTCCESAGVVSENHWGLGLARTNVPLTVFSNFLNDEPNSHRQPIETYCA
jgi:hypothetical protein